MTEIHLIVLTGSSSGETLVVRPPEATIGRSHKATLRIDDPSLSRLHFSISIAEDNATVQDLGSSNGTTLNGAPVTQEPRPLHAGDVLTAGDVALRVEMAQASDSPKAPQLNISNVAPLEEDGASQLFQHDDDKKSANSDPLLEEIDFSIRQTESEQQPTPPANKRRALVLGAILVLFVLCLGVLIFGFYSSGEKTSRPTKSPQQLAKIEDAPLEFRYERLSITDKSLFRYILTYTPSGTLSLSIDDLGETDRSFTKQKALSSHAQDVLRKEIIETRYTEIPELFPERSADGVTLQQRKVLIVLGNEIWERTAENVDVRQFSDLCSKLEDFAQNELGLWASRYSVAELQVLGKEQLDLARRYWEQRDLDDEKLFLALTAYKKGLSALETLNPKPEYVHDLTEGLQQADALLTERYAAVSFAVDQALNTQQYDTAAKQLRKILQMIPDRDDERNQKAMEKLLLVENRFLKKGGR